MSESVFDMDDMPAAPEEDTLGVLDEEEAETPAAEPDFPEPAYEEAPAPEPVLAEASLEFDEDIADAAAAAVGAAEEPPRPNRRRPGRRSSTMPSTWRTHAAPW